MIAKVAILFAALAAVSASGVLYGHGGLVNTGVSTSARSQDVSYHLLLYSCARSYLLKEIKELPNFITTKVINFHCLPQAFGNYAFGYDIKDGYGAANSRSEVGDTHGNKKGSYTIADIDGRARRVDYVADGHGFRATVKTNEPGTAASAPAAALIASPNAGPVAPVVNHVAPAAALVRHAASYAAPLAVVAPLAAPLAVAAPVAYGGEIGHGAALAPASLAYGAHLGLGYGLGLGKALLH
ncbi:adult-specific rigid cuticular protein 15.7 [Trichonephila clavata]|uniref:Adult-specific rigid cuticular protein 15.7 n=1 Tax=Trichonephila clavata TaxID=2740835 RepID=A0A8X6HW52_TRICU|nr:adult-specific rigid cuticular protein 15.7 [Trichonephila clavata]